MMFKLLMLALMAFGEKEISVLSPVQMDGAKIGEILVYPHGEDFLVEKGKLIELVSGRVRASVIQKLNAHSGARVSLQKDQFEGLEFRYDEERLILLVAIVPLARETSVITFRGPPVLSKRENIQRPAALSGYLNLRVSDQWEQPNFIDELQEGPIVGDVEGVLNIKGAVLQSRWSYNDESPQPLLRADTRVTWDQEESATRYSIGDVAYDLIGFQSFRPIGGISVAKNYSIQPYLVISPVARNKIFLNRKSTVKIYVNGRFYREIDLQAGEHDLRELPVVRGINQIEIEIEDDLGRKERVTYPFVSEEELLRKGLHQYGYTLGAPSSQGLLGEGAREYDGSHITFSGFHRYGFLDSLTTGIYAQGDKDQVLLGQELVLGSGIGLFAFDIATSVLKEQSQDFASRMRYRYLQDSSESRYTRNFGFNLEYTGRRFASLGTLSPDNQFVYSFDVNYSQPIWRRLRIGASYRLQLARPEFSDRATASLDFNYYGLSGHQFSLDLSRSEEGLGGAETQIFFSWLWTGENPKNFLLTNYSSLNHNIGSEYQYSDNLGSSRYDLSANIADAEDQSSAGAEFDFTHDKFIFFADHSRFFPKEQGLSNGARTRATFGSSFAFAGSEWALSRPISDSFAILTTKPHFKGKRIPVNSQGNYAETEIGFFNSAVLPTLTSYHYEAVNLDTSYLEPGFQLGEENFVVFPTLRSGVPVVIGTDATVFAQGRLVDDNGTSVPMEAGEIISTDDKKFLPVVFFTNRKGEFRIEGLIPGRFVMKLHNEKWESASFEIPEKLQGMIMLGNVQVKLRE